MVNAPLTPPPTTAEELQDEARTFYPSAPSTSTAPEPSSATRETSYQRAFPVIAELASENNIQRLIEVAERSDIDGEDDRHRSRLLVVAPLVVAYLITDDLPPARHVLTCLPDNLASQPLSQALLGLLASTWERNHPKVYSRASELFNLVGTKGIADPKLAQVVAGLVTTFIQTFRQRTFVLLAKAYTSLPLDLAEAYLGLKPDEIVTAAEQLHWSFNLETRVLVPPPQAPSAARSLDISASSLSTFHLVADSVAQLEI